MNTHQTALLDAAVRYHQQGFSMIPLQPKGKKPLIKWEEYQTRKASIAEIERWVSEHPDMNLGLVTGSVSGVAVVDIEAGGSAEGYPITATVRTGRLGYHLYYSIPKGVKIQTGTRVRELTDQRGEGGYVVAPPSATDNSYEWVVPFIKVSDLPPFPSEMFLNATKNDWREIPAAGISEGARNDSMTRVIGGMLGRLQKSEFESLGWPIALGVNQTMNPPMSESEVRGIFDGIASREGGSRKGADSDIQEFKTFTLAELYKEDLPVRWLVKDLVPLDAITAITGDSNSFKSFLTQNLAVNVITGEAFLGHFPIETLGKVLIVDEENSKTLLKRRFKDLGVESNSNLVFLSFANFRADSEKSIARLREVVQREKPAMVVLDSLVDIHGSNENDGIEMTSIFNTLRRHILTTDSALVVIHHRRKAQMGQGGNVGQNIRGSSGIRGAIDSHLAVDRKGKNDVRITQDKLRVQEQIDPFIASLVQTEEGYVAFAYQGKDQEHQEAILDLQTEIIEILTNSEDEWLEAKQFIGVLGVSRSVFNQAAAGLLAAERLDSKAGRNNRKLYALMTESEEPVEDLEKLTASAADDSAS